MLANAVKTTTPEHLHQMMHELVSGYCDVYWLLKEHEKPPLSSSTINLEGYFFVMALYSAYLCLYHVYSVFCVVLYVEFCVILYGILEFELHSEITASPVWWK